jgi:serine kinase of HPr protein (carbohydrate metabolism regulator)
MSGPNARPTVRHGGLIALRVAGLWRGALIEGASGVGKSDLALRALGEGFALVSDDQTVIFVSQGRLFGRAPDALGGLIEVRGTGVRRCVSLPCAEITVLARCAAEPGGVERHPDPCAERLLGVTTPVFALWPFERSAPAKLRRVLEHLGWRGQGEYQASLAPPGRSLGA